MNEFFDCVLMVGVLIGAGSLAVCVIFGLHFLYDLMVMKKLR